VADRLVLSLCFVRGLAAMSWAQGFFRIWVVVSMLWIGVTVFFNEPKTYTRLWGAAYEVKYQDGRVFELQVDQKRADLLLKESNRLEVQDIEAQLTTLDAEYRDAIEKAKTAWLLTVLPPLGFGLVIGWIARGFRPRTVG